MPYKPLPNKDYTRAIAKRDGEVIKRALRNAKAFDWSKLEKIQSILQNNTPSKTSGCFT